MSGENKSVKVSDLNLKIESILRPLANETRQKLLFIFAQGPITYTEVNQQTNLESGSFYWHLKKMNHLVQQTFDKKYELNDLGRKAYTLLYSEKEFPEEPTPPRWSKSIQNIFVKLEEVPFWILIQELILIIVLVSLSLNSQDIIQLGSLPTYNPDTVLLDVIISATLSLTVIAILVLLSIVIIEKRQDRKIERVLLIKTVIIVMLLNIVIFIPGMIATAIILLTDNPDLAFSIYIIFPASLISTLFSIVVTVALLQHSFSYEFNNSLLILLVCFYPFFLLSFLLQLM